MEIGAVLPSSRRRPQGLAADARVAEALLSGDARAQPGALLERTTGGVAPAFRVWVGVPCSRVWLETPVGRVDTLREVVEFDQTLRTRIPTGPNTFTKTLSLAHSSRTRAS